MESESQMGPGRYRASLILGLVLSVLMVVAGIWGIGWSQEPALGWLMLVAGIAIAILSVFQLRRS